MGNAVDWTSPDGRRFDYVHTLLDCVPVARRRHMLAHQLTRLVTPGGRLLASQYDGSGASAPPRPAQELQTLGCQVVGEAHLHDPAFERSAGTAWVIAPG